MYFVARALQFLALVVTGLAFFDGVLGGNVRRELVLLAIGAALFGLGRWLQAKH
ncbi:MAG TPA: hypothetical protein VGK08_04250 [Thermoanaerobaculia bacterium]